MSFYGSPGVYKRYDTPDILILFPSLVFLLDLQLESHPRSLEILQVVPHLILLV